MSARGERVAQAQGYDFGYNDDDSSDVWRPNNPWPPEVTAYSSEVQTALWDALFMLQNNARLQEISIPVSPVEHRVSLWRRAPDQIVLCQVRVKRGMQQWLERPVVVSKRVKDRFAGVFQIVTNVVMQSQGPAQSTPRRIETTPAARVASQSHAWMVARRPPSADADE